MKLRYRPDIDGREAILKIHSRKITLGPSVDLRKVAARTAGMVGADLANIINEAERNGLALLTTEKDLARMHGDATTAKLAVRSHALPVTLRITEEDDFRRLVLGARA